MATVIQQEGADGVSAPRNSGGSGTDGEDVAIVLTDLTDAASEDNGLSVYARSGGGGQGARGTGNYAVSPHGYAGGDGGDGGAATIELTGANFAAIHDLTLHAQALPGGSGREGGEGHGDGGNGGSGGDGGHSSDAVARIVGSRFTGLAHVSIYAQATQAGSAATGGVGASADYGVPGYGGSGGIAGGGGDALAEFVGNDVTGFAGGFHGFDVGLHLQLTAVAGVGGAGANYAAGGVPSMDAPATAGGDSGAARATVRDNVFTGGGARDLLWLDLFVEESDDSSQAGIASNGGPGGVQRDGSHAASGQPVRATLEVVNNTVDLGAGDDGLALQLDYMAGSTLTITGNTFRGGAGFDILSLQGGERYQRIPHWEFDGGGLTFSYAQNTVSGFERVNGTYGDDVITTGAEGETVRGDWGDDVIHAGGGVDTLDMGSYNNYLQPSGGVTVRLVGGTATGRGADTFSGVENVTGTDFDDDIEGDGGANRLMGEDGADRLLGHGGDDVLSGDQDDAADVLNGGAGVDTFRASDLDGYSHGYGVRVRLTEGSATYFYGGSDRDTDQLISIENVIGTDGYDIIEGDSGANRLEGGATSDVLAGHGGNDTLLGGTDGDWLYGHDAADRLVGGEGDDLLDGGAGTDTADYSETASRVSVDLSVADPQDTLGAGQDTLTAVENLIGSRYADTLTGNELNNVLTGGLGNDTLQGGLGNDTLDGGAGTDTASYAGATAAVNVALVAAARDTGSAGVDRLIAIENITGGGYDDRLQGDIGANGLTGGAGNDVLLGLAGDDVLNGGIGADVLVGGPGDDSLIGGTGADTAQYSDASAGVTVDLRTTVAQDTVGGGRDTLQQVENLSGSPFGDVLTGADGANVLRGEAGDDTLDGGGGLDTLIGGLGQDTLSGGLGKDTLYGGGGSDHLHGGEDADMLRGEDGLDTLNGDAGDDTIMGGADNDAIEGGDGNDKLYGDGGEDAVGGGQGADLLYGGEANDTLTGGEGDDKLHGEAGADRLTGGAGLDSLYGGAGADVFVFLSETDSGASVSARDVVRDFARADGDKIDLSGIDAVSGGTDDRFTLVDAFSKSAGQLVVKLVGSYSLVQGDLTGDGVADFSIAVTGATPLQEEDFLL